MNTRQAESQRESRKVADVHDDGASSSSAQQRELRQSLAKLPKAQKPSTPQLRSSKPAVSKQLSKNIKRDLKNSVTSGEQVSLEELNLNDGGRHGEDSEMSIDDENLM